MEVNTIPEDMKIEDHPGNKPDEYVRCPYFPEHELRKSRLPYHIMKCQSNPRAPKLLVCPFNYLHRVAPHEKNDHMILCEDRVYQKYSDSQRSPASFATTCKQLKSEAKRHKDDPRNSPQPIILPQEDDEKLW